MRRIALFGIVLAVLGASPLVVASWPRSWMFDLYQRIDPPRRDASRVTIVDIDEETVRRVGRWPWPRERLAQLVNRAWAARVIGLDILLLEADQTSTAGSDTRLASAISGAHVVLAATSEDVEQADAIRVPPILQSGDDAQRFVPAVPHVAWPLPSIARDADGAGLALILPEGDGVVRRLPTIFAHGSTLLPSFAIEVLLIADGGAVLRVRSDALGMQRLSIGRFVASTDPDGALWPRFSREVPARTIPAYRVLTGDVDPALLDGRIVLVGSSLAGLGDVHLTPLHNVETGTAINAQLIASLMAGDTLWRPAIADIAEALTLMALGIASLVLSGRIPLRAQATLVAAVVGLLAAASLHAFAAAGMLLDWTFPSTGIVLVNIGLGAVRVRGDRRARRLAEASLGLALNEVEQARSVITQALNSTKLATLGEMASVLAHELRQPIATMSMAAENAEAALQDGSLDLVDARSRIDRIIAQAARAESMIEHLGVFARADTGALASVDIGDAVRAALSLVEPSLRRQGINTAVSLEPGLGPVSAVGVLLEQVVINLCTNARDALGEVDPSRRTIGIDARAIGDAVMLEVVDSGPGIASDALGRLFEPFYTTKPAGAGVGLGLSVGRRIIQSFGGTLTARNRDGGGAVFSIMLPRSEPISRESARSDSPPGERW